MTTTNLSREEAVRRAVLDALAAQTGLAPDTVDPDRPMISLPGVESVHLLRAVAEVEEACGVAVPEDLLFGPVSARQFAELVVSLENSR